MTKRKILPWLLALLLAAALLLEYRLVHPVRWSSELLEYLDHAETVTGEAVLRGAAAPLSDEQVARVLSAIRGAKISDNRDFAGTTWSGWIRLDVDGEKIDVCCLDDTEIQYHWGGENRSVRAAGDGYAHSLREIMREALLPPVPY